MDEIIEDNRKSEIDSLMNLKDSLIFRGLYLNAKDDNDLEEIAWRNKIAKGDLIRTMITFGNQVLNRMESEGKIIDQDAFKRELEFLIKKD